MNQKNINTEKSIKQEIRELGEDFKKLLEGLKRYEVIDAKQVEYLMGSNEHARS